MARIPLRKKVPWIPDFEEVLNGRDREVHPALVPNVQGVGYDGPREEEIRDAVHEEAVVESMRTEWY